MFKIPHSPLVVIACLYTAGILLGSTFHINPMLTIIPTGAVFLAALVGYCFTWRYHRQVLFLLFLFLGILSSGLALEQSKSVLTEYAGNQVTVVGYLATEADVRSDKVFYTLKVRELRVGQDRLTVDGLVRLQISGAESGLRYGDLVQVCGLLTRPELPGNPGAFNYRSYLERQGLSGVLLVKGEADLEKIQSVPVNPLLKAAHALKERLAYAATASLEPAQAALFNGVVFGDQGRIDPQTRKAFTETGVVHILSVSGLHVGFVIGGLYGLLRLLRVRPERTAPVLTPVLLFYVLMVGFAPSVLRAAVMGLLLLWADHWNRRRDWPTTMAVAVLLILLGNPLQIYHPGFQLSFAATWGILYLIPFLNKVGATWLGALPGAANLIVLSLFVTVAAELATIPLIAWYYNLVSPVSLLANLIVTPLVGLIIFAGFLAALLGQLWLPLAELINASNGLFIDILLKSAVFFQKLPGAVYYLPAPPIALMVAWYGGLLALVRLYSGGLPEVERKRLAGWLAVGLLGGVVLLGGWSWFGEKRELRVHFIDVGQGDSILIQSPYGRTMLIDCGGRRGEWESGSGAGESAVTPYLRNAGVRRLDLLVLTHPHDDHAAGAVAVAENLPIGRVLATPLEGAPNNLADSASGSAEGNEVPAPYLKLLKGLSEKGVPIDYATAGERLKLDRVTEVAVLWPLENGNGAGTNLNDQSLVLKVTYGAQSFLFTGDIEPAAQSELLRESGELHANVLKMPHHGSRFLLPEFLDAVAPDIAVISVGAYNSFGHPALSTLEQLGKRQIETYRTDQDGAVVIRSDGRKLEVETGKKGSQVQQPRRQAGRAGLLGVSDLAERFSGS